MDQKGFRVDANAGAQQVVLPPDDAFPLGALQALIGSADNRGNHLHDMPMHLQSAQRMDSLLHPLHLANGFPSEQHPPDKEAAFPSLSPCRLRRYRA